MEAEFDLTNDVNEVIDESSVSKLSGASIKVFLEIEHRLKELDSAVRSAIDELGTYVKEGKKAPNNRGQELSQSIGYKESKVMEAIEYLDKLSLKTCADITKLEEEL